MTMDRGTQHLERRQNAGLWQAGRRTISRGPWSFEAIRIARLWSVLLLAVVGGVSAANAQVATQFPLAPVGGAGVTESVIVTVSTGGTVGTVEVLTGGAPGLDYASAGGSCAQGNQYNAGDTCTVAVTFTPKYAGARAGAVVLLNGNGSPIATELLYGTGAGAQGIFVPGTINTVAGDGNFTSLKDGGPATAADLNLPFGVAVDGYNNFYIADTQHNRIRKVDGQTQIISTIAGTGVQGYAGDGGPATQATLGTPKGLAIDGAGNLYFADTAENVVRRIDAATQIITTVAGTGASSFSGDGGAATLAALSAPTGVSFDQSGNMYIADTANGRIRKVDAVTGVITTVAGTGVVSGPLGDGGSALQAALNLPYTATFDASGNMYIPDSGNNRIRVVNAATGAITTFAGNGGQGYAGDGGAATAAMLYSPFSVAFDPAGNMYTADTQNYRVRKVVNGIISTIAGSGAGTFGGDGSSATAAGIYAPYFVYLDAAGDLYITEYYDHRIRKIDGNAVTLDYPTALRVGQKSVPQLQALENDGNAVLTLASILPDSNAAVDAQTTSCSLSSDLAVGASCITGAVFAPTQVGDPETGHIVLTGNAGDSPMTITLVGTSLALNSTDVSLTSTLNPSVYGQSVTFIASVSSGTGLPTGTVTFKDGATTLGTGTLNSSDTAQFSTSTLVPGLHSITAVYAGDSAHGGSTSGAVAQQVQSNTVTTLASSANPVSVKTQITLTAHVAQSSGAPVSAASAPTGTVLFYDGATALGTGTLDANGNATLTTSALPTGSQSLTARYVGDTANLPSVSSALIESVGQDQTTTVFASSLDPSVFGNPVTFTATVTVTGSGTATGAVNFLDGANQVGSAALDGTGTATITLATLQAGTHALKALYTGDTNDAGSTSPSFTQTVQQAATATAVTATPNPAIAGKALVLTATVTDTTGAGTPGGTVVFQNGAVVLGTATLNSAGVASISATLGAGATTITAKYSGDANHLPSTGALALSAQQATTVINVSGTPNPSVLGSTVTFALAVTGNGGVPTGAVSLAIDGAAAGSATLNDGSASFTIATLTVGTHQVTASYAGDTNDSSSITAQAYVQTVQKAATTLALSATPNPVLQGNTVTFTALVRNTSGSPAPSGTVQFTDGATVLGAAVINGSGVATLGTSQLPPGDQNVTATYSGDANYVGAANTVNENVQRATTAVLTASANPAYAGTPLTFSVKVTGTSSTVPTGTVTLQDGGAALAVLPLNAAGIAQYQTSTLSVGTHLLTAAYSGDASNGPANAPTLSEVVQQAATTTGAGGDGQPICGRQDRRSDCNGERRRRCTLWPGEFRRRRPTAGHRNCRSERAGDSFPDQPGTRAPLAGGDLPG